MNILITSMFYEKSFGQGLCARKLAEYLAEKGHKITVLHGEKQEFSNKKNLIIERINSTDLKGVDILSFAFNLKQKVLQPTGFDVIYAQDYSLGLIDFTKISIPLIYHARGTVKGNSLNRPKASLKTELGRKMIIPLMIEMDKNCCQNAKRIITASKTIKQEIISFYGIAEEKISIVGDGVDLKKFIKSKDVLKKAEKLRNKLKLNNKKVLLFAGRLVPQKGIIYLIKALTEITKKFPELILLIAGKNTSENYKKVIQKEIKKNNVSEFIKFIGYIEQDSMPELIELSDLIVSPSTYEPIGIINIEAIAMNKPIVIPKSIGSIDLLRESALIVNPENPKEISDAVIKIFSSKKLYKKLSEKGRINAEKTEWNKIGKKIEEILSENK